MRPALVPAVVIAAIVLGQAAATADLENQVFTSKADRLRLVVPRGWRATDLPSYPGLLLWLLKSQPEGKIVLSAETFTRELYCTWPVSCRTSHETPTRKFACALRAQLQNLRMHMPAEGVQAGPKENEEAGLPSVWFEYDDGRHFFRQALAVTEDRVISLVLSAPSLDTRSQQIRSFEQTLRSLRPLTPEELGTSAQAAAATPDQAPADAGVPPDAGVTIGVTKFASPPAPQINPVGPCAK